jgi:hypothetical protein
MQCPSRVNPCLKNLCVLRGEDVSYFGLKPFTLLAVYFLQAFSKSTSLMFASVHSQAKTSANSSCLFLSSLETRAVDSSPTSSINHINVAGIPLSRSRFSYFFEISSWNSLICILPIIHDEPQAAREITERYVFRKTIEIFKKSNLDIRSFVIYPEWFKTFFKGDYYGFYKAENKCRVC